jgi:hypothetical protein
MFRSTLAYDFALLLFWPHPGSRLGAITATSAVLVPTWLRRAVPDAQGVLGKDIEDMALVAGPAIGALDAVVRRQEQWAGAWRPGECEAGWPRRRRCALGCFSKADVRRRRETREVVQIISRTLNHPNRTITHRMPPITTSRLIGSLCRLLDGLICVANLTDYRRLWSYS